MCVCVRVDLASVQRDDARLRQGITSEHHAACYKAANNVSQGISCKADSRTAHAQLRGHAQEGETRLTRCG
jgi:hypothetical protein